jgi:hypothetical protein
MARFARINSGVVAEIIVLPEGTAIETAFHPEIIAALVICSEDVKQGWSYSDGEFAPSFVEEAPLDKIKAALKVTVDTTAEAERKKYITPGEGQAMTYQRKVEEAKRAILEEEPAAADYPMLAASVGVDGDTVKEIATIVLAMDAAWAVIGSAIEKTRLNVKKAIDEAVSAEAANAAVNALVWPEGVVA